MKHYLLLFLLFLTLAASGNDDPKPLNPRKFKFAKEISPNDYLPNTIIVKFKESVTRTEIIKITSSYGLSSLGFKSDEIKGFNQVFKETQLSSLVPLQSRSIKVDSIGLDRIYELKFTSNKSVEEAINEILLDQNIEYAEPSYIYYSSFIPNDTFYNTYQNYLRQIQADKAWDLIRNSSNSIIAIIDSGSDLNHVDLKANILLPGKDLVGLSFKNPQEDDDPGVKSDSTDHGVRVSGVASAVSNNGIGISSVAFNAKLMIVKVGSDDNARAIYRGYEGIKYAVDNGAHIINCSWGGPGGSAFGQDIINYAISKGSLVIAAAGNSNNSSLTYPASYPGVMGVAAVDFNDTKSSYSNFGFYISITAPGDVITTANGNRYSLVRGTSFSTPLVASAAALVKARFPLFDMSQVREQLLATADNIDAINPNHVGLLGKGRLNVFRAVSETLPSIRYQKLLVLDNANGSRPPGDTLKIFFDLKNFLSPAFSLGAKLSSSNPNVQIIDSEFSIGDLATSQIKTMVGPFRVYVKPGVAENELIDFLITYSASNPYINQEKIQIRVALDYLNIEVNQVATSMTSIGRVGFTDWEMQNGLGFVYKDDPLLFEASLMIGASPTQVSNNTRNDLDLADEHFRKKKTVFKIIDPNATFLGQSEFDDSGSTNPMNLYIKNQIRAFSVAPDDNYVLVDYEIQNKGSSALSGIYVGLFTDWDVDENGRDITQYDVFNRLAYVYGKFGNTPYAGVKLLSTEARPLYYPMTYELPGDPLESGNGFSLSEKYISLTSGIKSTSLGENSANGHDVMFVSGNGPYQIPANASIKVSFAMLAGDNLTDLLASAKAAQKKYDDLNKAFAALANEGFILEQNYPNPAFNQSTIKFGIERDGNVSIFLYNTLGKKVKNLFSGRLSEGFHTINVDTFDLDSGIYVYKMLFEGKEKSLKMIITK
jgi:hypothetical protein